MRALCGVTVDEVGHLAHKLEILIKLLAEIPPEWWPHDSNTWKQFAIAVQSITNISRQPITTSANQLWLRQCAKSGFQIPDRTPDDVLQIAANTDHFIASLMRALQWVLSDVANASPQSYRKHPLEIAGQIVANMRKDMGLEKMSRQAKRFGDAYRREVTNFAEQAKLWEGVCWPSVSAKPCVYDDVVIHPLLTVFDLKEEGGAMSNCVADYAGQCMDGNAQIWSVRSLNGHRLSTLGTKIDIDGFQRKILKVMEHFGPRNENPMPMAVQAAQSHLEFFSENQEGIKSYLKWRGTFFGKSLKSRNTHARMQPIVSALQQTLSGRWAWQKLIESSQWVERSH